MRFKKALITGGAGFIGSHLADALLARGCQVTVVDNLSTGKWKNIDHLKDNLAFRAIIASCAERDVVRSRVEDTKARPQTRLTAESNARAPLEARYRGADTAVRCMVLMSQRHNALCA